MTMITVVVASAHIVSGVGDVNVVANDTIIHQKGDSAKKTITALLTLSGQ